MDTLFLPARDHLFSRSNGELNMIVAVDFRIVNGVADGFWDDLYPVDLFGFFGKIKGDGPNATIGIDNRFFSR